MTTDNERALAHVEVILALSPIEGADKIERATILGWQSVVKKDEFKVGDKVIYVEVDSVMPERPTFIVYDITGTPYNYNFLTQYNYRVRTIKLKRQVSQGLVLPIELCNRKDLPIGTDVTELLGITKYLSPTEKNELQQKELKVANEKNKLKKFMMRYSWFRRLFLSRKQKGGFPYWVNKTDEERIQNIPHVLEQFADKEVYVTEKIDYQSGTWTGKLVPKFGGLLGKLIPIKKYQFVVCSRNLTTNDKSSLYWKIAKKYNLEQILRDNPTLTIQGEQGDTKVQGNKYGITEPTMWVFNIIDHEKNYHFDYIEMSEFCKKYKLNVVPVLIDSPEKEHDYWNTPYTTELKHYGSTVQELVEFSKGKSVINPKVEREGIVIRCIEDGKKVLSFKVINPDFLLKYDL